MSTGQEMTPPGSLSPRRPLPTPVSGLRPPPYLRDDFRFRPSPMPHPPGPAPMDPLMLMRIEREEREAKEKREREEREARERREREERRLEKEEREAKEERRWKMEMEEKKLEKEEREAKEKREMEERRLEREEKERRWREEMEERRLERESREKREQLEREAQKQKELDFEARLEEERERLRAEVVRQLDAPETQSVVASEHGSDHRDIADFHQGVVIPVAPPKLHMPVYSASDNIDTYIEHFEAVAAAYQLTDQRKALYLISSLTGKAKEAFVDIPPGASYTELKAALRRRLHMTSESYRKHSCKARRLQAEI